MAESMTRTSQSRGRSVSNNSDSNWGKNERKNTNHREQQNQNKNLNNHASNSRSSRNQFSSWCNKMAKSENHELPSSSSSTEINTPPITQTKTFNNGHNMPSTSSQSTNVVADETTSNCSDSDSPMNATSDNKTNGTSGVRCEHDNATRKLSSMVSITDWVNAPEFVPSQPKHKSYAQAVNPIDESDFIKFSEQRLCPYITKEGYCKYPPGECANLHGDLCDLCGKAVMHPYNEELRKKHHKECIKQHEKDMELSFALARSKEKSCGVCFEVIMEKAIGEQRFGILPNCNHCFCLTCIRKWRQARQFENKIIRACPECRITSDFVCPSMYWVDTKEDKDKLINDYKNALSKKDCKYFKKGSGKCPFGNKCFYLHAFPNGRVCDVGPPPRQRRRRHFEHTDLDVLQHVILWDFLDDRANPWQSLADDLEDLVSFFSDSEDSDWSGYDMWE